MQILRKRVRGEKRYAEVLLRGMPDQSQRDQKEKAADYMNAVEPVIGLQHQEYLTFAKAAILMGCSRQYVYKLVNEGKLAASRISSRMALISKADIANKQTKGC